MSQPSPVSTRTFRKAASAEFDGVSIIYSVQRHAAVARTARIAWASACLLVSCACHVMLGMIDETSKWSLTSLIGGAPCAVLQYVVPT